MGVWLLQPDTTKVVQGSGDKATPYKVGHSFALVQSSHDASDEEGEEAGLDDTPAH